jgi:hypothetical protein
MKINNSTLYNLKGEQQDFIEDIIEDIKVKSVVYQPIKNNRVGVVFSKGSTAKQIHRKILDLNLSPTKIIMTEYGFAFKFNDPLIRAKKIDAITKRECYPYTLMTEKTREYITEGYTIYDVNSKVEYRKFNPTTATVLLSVKTPLKKPYSYSMKTYNVPFPPTKGLTGKTIPMITLVKPLGEPFTPTSTTTFIKYSEVEIKLNLGSGHWIYNETTKFYSLAKDKLSNLLLEMLDS